MKLFFIWLLGVPLMVASLVAVSAIGHRIATASNISYSECLRNHDLDGVASSIANQRHHISCNGRAVKQ
jgi:hypothetical protein